MFLLLLLFLLGNADSTNAVTTKKPSLALPGCPEGCGNGVVIPYPFGIGSNCSREEDFNVQCVNKKPFIGVTDTDFQYEVTNISLQTSEIRILLVAKRQCNTSTLATADGTYLPDAPGYVTPPCFEFSHTKNRLTAVGCNAFGAMITLNGGALGCLATCQSNHDKLLADDSCSGFGCCQTSMPSGQNNVFLAMRRISNDTFNWVKGDNFNSDGTRSCSFVFVVEAANYTFKKSHLSWPANRTFPAILDWFIYNQTCKQAQRNKTSYACRSSSSVCHDKASSESYSYFCNCSRGYRGSPYITGGCQDINECLEPKKYPCNGICINTPGGYHCNPLLTPPQSSKSNTTLGIIIGLSIGSGCLMLFILSTLLYKRVQKKKSKLKRERFFRHNYNLLIQQQKVNPNGNANVINTVKFFSLKDIEKATNYFDSSRIVGQGGHGTVYKGLFELKVAAVKKPKMVAQDEITEFLNEVILLSQMSHRNVVQLIGCCLETEVPFLVYEFISNGTLFDHLHKRHQESQLSWEDRLRIATEMSAGLAYLHTAANISILHRDIKSANILVDERLSAKISDFGASRTIQLDQTHISTNIQGTLGYMDPEYMHTGQLTDKSDVYSLGVILVELLTGQRPNSLSRCQEEGNLISHFNLAFNKHMLYNVVDPFILNDVTKEDVEIVASLAVDCLSLKGKDRPAMKDVELTLGSLMKEKKIRNVHYATMPYAESKNMKSEDSILLGSETTTEDESINHDCDGIPFE